jgi:hypothetical protein
VPRIEKEADETTDDALYEALRALEAKAMTYRRTAANYAGRVPTLHENNLAEAVRLDGKVTIMRKLLTGNEPAQQFWNRCGWTERSDLKVLQRQIRCSSEIRSQALE